MNKNGLAEKEVGSTNRQIPQQEDAFLKKVKDIMQNHLSDPQFSITQLAQKIALSNTQLHRKVVALTGQPPIKLMKTMRINKAKELLLTTTSTISEVAYQVGFSDPSYFSKTFKSAQGLSPKDYRQKMS